MSTEGHPITKGQASLIPLSPQHHIFLVLRARTKLRLELGQSKERVGSMPRGTSAKAELLYPGNGTLHLPGYLSGGRGAGKGRKHLKLRLGSGQLHPQGSCSCEYSVDLQTLEPQTCSTRPSCLSTPPPLGLNKMCVHLSCMCP